MAVAGFGDAASFRVPSTAVFTRGQPEIGHQISRVRKPAEVVQLGQYCHRCYGVDAAKTAEPAHPFRVGFFDCGLFNLGVQNREAFFYLF